MQRCLIIGANRGLGLAFTRQLLMRGARVLACCRDLDEADDLRKLREEYSDDLIVHALDVADSAAIAALPKAAEKHLQGIDLLINNAGVRFRTSISGMSRRNRWRAALRSTPVRPC